MEDASLESFDFTSCPTSLLADREVFSLIGVCIKRPKSDYTVISSRDFGEGRFVSGKLSIIEKVSGVVIEWKAMDEDGWVITSIDNDGDTSDITSLSLINDSIDIYHTKLSVDLDSLGSFKCVEPKSGYSWIRFIGKDGHDGGQLFFCNGGLSSFIEAIRRYVPLKRSSQDSNLVLLLSSESSLKHLQQSICLLNMNNDNDFLTRKMTQPYTTALRRFRKIAHFVQNQLITSLLESNTKNAEEQIRAMRELREKHHDDFVDKLRLISDAGFELITQLELPERSEVKRDKPLKEAIVLNYKQRDGSFKNVDKLKSLIFRGGLEMALRRDLWNFLLGVFGWEYTHEDIVNLREKHKTDYQRMKLQWKSISDEQKSHFNGFAVRETQIRKDVIRTDQTHPFYADNESNTELLFDILMTYCMFDFDLGYVQGMSDLLSPLLVVMQNEVDAFWAFVALMKRVHGNFEMDQECVKKQFMDLRDLLVIINPKLVNYLESQRADDMYFCFRWILVLFKREFAPDDIMKLWEILWTDLPCTNFHLLICVAILDSQMEFIVEKGFGLNEILEHINKLSMKIDLDETLKNAEAIYYQLCSSRNTLPDNILNILSL